MSGALKAVALAVGMVVRCTDALNRAWKDGDMTITRVDAVQTDEDQHTGKRYVEANHETRGTGGFFVGDGDMLLVKDSHFPPAIKAGTQLAKVYDLTKSGSHWTLEDIKRLTGASEAAASARLRDLRKLGLDVKCHKHKGEKVRTYTVQPKEVATA